VFVGRVVSNRMQKTVVVAVNYVVWVPKYGVYEKRVSRHMAHDDEQKCVVGDVVKITSAGRKLSKHKSYNVAQVLLATPSYNPEQAAKDVQERLANRPTSMVAAARARLEASQARLQALRGMYAKELGKMSGFGRNSNNDEGRGEDGSVPTPAEDSAQGASRSGSSSADQGSRRGDIESSSQSSSSSSSSNNSSTQEASTSSMPRGSSGSFSESTVPGTAPSGVRTACTLAHGFDQHPGSLAPLPAYPLRSQCTPKSLAFRWEPVSAFVRSFLGRWPAFSGGSC